MTTKEELSVTIDIAGRQYRLKTDVQGKGMIERAAAHISETVSLYTGQYNCRDTQDLLAMVLMHHTVNMLQRSKEIGDASVRVESQVRLIGSLLSEESNTQHVL